MIMQHTTEIKSTRFFTTISPKNRFDENLNLTLSLSEHNSWENFDWGFIDLHYNLINNKTEFKRTIIKQDDFTRLAFQLKINTGDLLTKIRIGLYFKKDVSVKQFLETILKEDNDPKTSNLIFSASLKELIKDREPIDFLEKIRSMSVENFKNLIDTDLPALHTLIDKAPERVFYYWALADTIIKKTASGKLSLSYLDRAVDSYYKEYNSGKIGLGFNPENVLV